MERFLFARRLSLPMTIHTNVVWIELGYTLRRIVDMRRSIVTLAFVLSLLLPVMTAPSYAVSTDPISATNAAITWLRTQQQDNGSFPGFGPGDQGFDPIFAFAAAGMDAHSVARPGGQSLVS